MQTVAVPLPWRQRIVVMNTRAGGFVMSPTQMICQNLADLWLA